MQINFVTGKGGVGKSAVAAGLAYKFASQGQKTLLIELGDLSYFQHYFSLRKVEFEAVEIAPHLNLSIWSPEESLYEYIRYLVKSETLAQLFFKNPVTKALVRVAPGLNELAILGKITSGPPRNVGPKLDFDVLVVDAFSSGHFLSMLRAPQGLAQVIQYGPMGEQSRSIFSVLKEPSICRYYVVSTPEELPIVEAEEQSLTLKKEFSILPTQVLNRVLTPPDSFKGADPGLEGLLKHLQFQVERDKKFSTRLRNLGEVNELPFVLSHDAWTIVKTLAKELQI